MDAMALLLRLSRRCAPPLARPAVRIAAASAPFVGATYSSGCQRSVHSMRRPSMLVSARAPIALCLGGCLGPIRAASSAKSTDKFGVVNEDINAAVVQLVGDDGKMRTNVPLRQAIDEARRKGVDLVQVSQSGRQVVCRMFDAKKRAFALKKSTKQQKPKPDKEVVFSVKIAVHDLNVKVNQVKKFLAKEHKVKVTVKFGNQFHLKDTAVEQLEMIQGSIDAESGAPDSTPRIQFGGVFVFYSPAK